MDTYCSDLLMKSKATTLILNNLKYAYSDTEQKYRAHSLHRHAIPPFVFGPNRKQMRRHNVAHE